MFQKLNTPLTALPLERAQVFGFHEPQGLRFVYFGSSGAAQVETIRTVAEARALSTGAVAVLLHSKSDWNVVAWFRMPGGAA